MLHTRIWQRAAHGHHASRHVYALLRQSSPIDRFKSYPGLFRTTTRLLHDDSNIAPSQSSESPPQSAQPAQSSPSPPSSPSSQPSSQFSPAQSATTDKISALQIDMATTSTRLDHLKESFGIQVVSLKSAISALDTKFDTKFNILDTKLSALTTEFNAFKAEFNAFKAEFNAFKVDVKAEFNAFKVDVKADINTISYSLNTKIDSKFAELQQQQMRLVWRVVFTLLSSVVVALGGATTLFMRDRLAPLETRPVAEK
ncbi:hypothetical protein P152DRAFT_453585 [Eremomyces bilateralis CBS 781.70]|uniref:Uncharacterized protein n=1 Tax=Eremomyces bilateralis CBS 781.70 TaxID=1392243 RepID=A0A6G1GGH9_9PEZI|nr:uncharacterized protein P152DRAFT_453585 [Eremomyces bilateralis CBS 781.70]KAF1816979.1 hypothetical protein P152DRAFT_453585 [Eremomyces bilateralis CBS 781.70]